MNSGHDAMWGLKQIGALRRARLLLTDGTAVDGRYVTWLGDVHFRTTAERDIPYTYISEIWLDGKKHWQRKISAKLTDFIGRAE